MSGLYNVVFGQHREAPILLHILQARESMKVGRFRDAWVERHGDQVLIRVLTRNGGGNRPDYQAEIESMRAHPWYHHDEDQHFDGTYADFYFDPIKDTPEVLPAFWQFAIDPVDMDLAWQEAIDKLGREGPTPEMMESFGRHVQIITPEIESEP